MQGKIIAGAILPVFLVALAIGCGRRTENNVVYYAAASPNQSQEDAYYRNLYNQRRPTPPETFSVPPKPPRDNSFGEFSDDLYATLDRQPELPPLPEERHIPPQTGIPQPPPGFSASTTSDPAPVAVATHPTYPTAPELAAAPRRRTTASPSRIHGPELREINAGNSFYPVEQLIYGGDFPDLDQPESYRLMPRDEINVMVKDHPEFSSRLKVQPDGTVNPQNTPDIVRVRGLTTEEAAEAIRRALAVYVKGDCVVRVQANRAGGGYYFVFGDVLQPGRFPMGMEPVKLSDAVLAANWEANPARLDLDGEDLGPSFPAASPRGKYIAPQTADLAAVMLVTPHRSQPVRTFHDVRAALMGMTGDDPVVRPGQIIVVPSLDKNRNAGLPEAPEGLMPGRGFASAGTPARLPEVEPAPRPKIRVRGTPPPAVELNMETTSDTVAAGEGPVFSRYNPETDYPDFRERLEAEAAETRPRRSNRVEGW